MASFFLVNHNFIGSCEPRFFELIRRDPNSHHVFLLIGLLPIRNKQGLPVKGNSFDPTALAFSGTRFSSAFASYGRKERRISRMMSNEAVLGHFNFKRFKIS